MSITTLYNTEQRLKSFSQALEYARDLNPLEAEIALNMEVNNDAFGIAKQFTNNISKPIYDVISTQQGLEAAKEKITEMMDDLSDHAKKTIMMVLYRAPSKLRSNASEMLSHCLKHCDEDTQGDFLVTGPFVHTDIESDDFDIESAQTALKACGKDAQDYIFETSAHEAMLNLGLYTFNVRVSKSNTGMALMREPREAVIPFDQIENDRIRAYCKAHEKDIRNSVAMLHPDLSEDILDKLEKTYQEHGFDFDREAESDNRSQEFREQIAGMTRADYWKIFLQHTAVMNAVMEIQNQAAPSPDIDNPHDHD